MRVMGLYLTLVLGVVIVSACCTASSPQPPAPQPLQTVSSALKLNTVDNWYFSCSSTTDKDEMIKLLARRDYVNCTEFWKEVSPQQLKSYHSDLVVYRFYDLMIKNDFDSDWRNPSDTSSMQTPITKADIDANDWWLRDHDGNIVKFEGSDKVWFLDVGKPGFKEAFLKAVLERNVEKGFDGFMFDQWWPSLTWLVPSLGGSMPPQGYASDVDWYERAWKPFVIYVTNGLHKAGYKVIGNSIGTYRDGNQRNYWQRSKVDGCIYESFAIDWPEDGSGWLSGAAIVRCIDAFSNDPMMVFATDYGLQSQLSDFDQKKYAALALYYIAIPLSGKARSYNYCGDRCIFWDTLWDFDIGSPTQLPVKGFGKYFWVRKYSKGMALLNYEATQSITYFLSRTYYDPNGNALKTKVTLPPHTGLLLRNSPPVAAETVSFSSPSPSQK